MRTLIASLIVAAICVTAPAASGGGGDVRGPFLLVTLPSLGTVTWKCDGQWGFALAYNASPRYATTNVVWSTRGGSHRSRTVQPGDRISFPFSKAPAQALTFGQGTGAGTLQAWVVAEFPRNRPTVYCNHYAPPRISVRVLPRS